MRAVMVLGLSFDMLAREAADTVCWVIAEALSAPRDAVQCQIHLAKGKLYPEFFVAKDRLVEVDEAKLKEAIARVWATCKSDLQTRLRDARDCRGRYQAEEKGQEATANE
jgi:hypothetical protein